MFGRPLLVEPNQSMPESSRTAQRDVGGSFLKKMCTLETVHKNVAGPLVRPCLSHIFLHLNYKGSVPDSQKVIIFVYSTKILDSLS